MPIERTTAEHGYSARQAEFQGGAMSFNLTDHMRDRAIE
jgi:hypothetical protein